MLTVLKRFYFRYFSEQEAVVLFLFLVASFFIIWFLRAFLAPVFASIVISYLLDGFVVRLTAIKFPHTLAVIIVYLAFMGLLFFILLGPIPQVWEQLTHLMNELPRRISQGQHYLTQLSTRYPDFFSSAHLETLIDTVRGDMAKFGQIALSASLASIPSLIEIVIYLILVPILVYFFLKDKFKLLNWFRQYLPRHNHALQTIWLDLKLQIGNYVRGKIWEVIIIWLVTYVAFVILKFKYAMLMSALVGFSVIIPYIGAVLVTIPVATQAFLQWGWSSQSAYLLITYAIIITLDANVLVPILFSGAVSLHPVAIIIAVLIAGGLFGFWGVFFAIPLASLVKAIVQAWPVSKRDNLNH